MARQLGLGRASGPRLLGLVAAIALFAALIITGRLQPSTGHRPAAHPGPAAAAAPYRVGGSVHCPLGWPVLALANKVSYPPGYPRPLPRGTTAVGCYQTATQAAAAGYPPAPPPAGVLELGGVYLAPTTSQLHRQCHKAADRLGFAVPCPMLPPTPSPNTASPTLCDQRFLCIPGFGFLFEESGFVVPPGYVGADPASGARLAIAAARQPTASPVSCAGERPVATVAVRGTHGGLFECPPESGVHFGSVLLRWRERGVFMVVSLHGHTQLNQRLVTALAAHAKPVPPSQ